MRHPRVTGNLNTEGQARLAGDQATMSNAKTGSRHGSSGLGLADRETLADFLVNLGKPSS